MELKPLPWTKRKLRQLERMTALAQARVVGGTCGEGFPQPGHHTPSPAAPPCTWGSPSLLSTLETPTSPRGYSVGDMAKSKVEEGWKSSRGEEGAQRAVSSAVG